MTSMKTRIAACLAALLAGPAMAHAHSFYTGKKNPVSGFGCCNNVDCQPIPQSSVKPTDDGWQITLNPGDHPRVTKPHVFIVPHNEVLFSPDGEPHACLYPTEDTIRCVFVPSGGA